MEVAVFAIIATIGLCLAIISGDQDIHPALFFAGLAMFYFMGSNVLVMNDWVVSSTVPLIFDGLFTILAVIGAKLAMRWWCPLVALCYAAAVGFDTLLFIHRIDYNQFAIWSNRSFKMMVFLSSCPGIWYLLTAMSKPILNRVRKTRVIMNKTSTS